MKNLKEITIGDMLSNYTIDNRKLGSNSLNTIKAYHRELEKFIEFLESKNISTTMDSFNRENVLEYLACNKDKAVSSKNRFLTIIKNFSKYCINIGNIEVDSKIMFIPHIKQKKTIKHILTTQQLETLKNYIYQKESTREQVVFELFSRTGIRLNEGINLKWRDIDFSNDKIYIIEGKSGDREIPLHPKLKNILNTYREERKEERNVDSEYILIGQKLKTKMSKAGLSYLINSLVEKAGLPSYVTPHTFRHTFATQLLRSCGNLEVVKKVLGHSDISITQLYLHLDDVDTKKAVFSL